MNDNTRSYLDYERLPDTLAAIDVLLFSLAESERQDGGARDLPKALDLLASIAGQAAKDAATLFEDAHTMATRGRV